MKKLRSFTAFLLALSMLAPTAALVSCKEEESQTALPPTTEAPIEDETTAPPSNTDGPTDEPADEPADEPTEEEPPQPVIEYASYIRCTGDSVNIRAGAGTSYAVLGSAEQGETYAVVGRSGSWYKTYYKNKVAYISASYAAVFSLEKADEEVEDVLFEGYKLLGVPYVYGAVRLHDGKGKLLSGFTTQKFDCSSLVQYVFYQGAGKLLDVNTRTQVKQGVYVKPSDLQRGDCIFFTNESRQYLSGIERVGHVAIYLGNNYILHTASDYARIEKISAARWNFYIEARRFL